MLPVTPATPNAASRALTISGDAPRKLVAAGTKYANSAKPALADSAVTPKLAIIAGWRRIELQVAGSTAATRSPRGTKSQTPAAPSAAPAATRANPSRQPQIAAT